MYLTVVIHLQVLCKLTIPLCFLIMLTLIFFTLDTKSEEVEVKKEDSNSPETPETREAEEVSNSKQKCTALSNNQGQRYFSVQRVAFIKCNKTENCLHYFFPAFACSYHCFNQPSVFSV